MRYTEPGDRRTIGLTDYPPALRRLRDDSRRRIPHRLVCSQPGKLVARGAVVGGFRQ